MSEAKEQEAFIQWTQYFPELKWVFAIPNGGSRHPAEARNLKRQGVKAGVSDLFVPIPSGQYHGLFIEMKIGKNKPTEKQKEFIADMLDAGYQAEVCYGAEEAIEAVKKYLKKP